MKYTATLLICALAVLLVLNSCSLFRALPKPETTEQRIQALASIPTPQLQAPVEVYWNQYMVPFIVAETDHDAAFILGLVQAHLRLGQMEFGKRVAYGRLSEMLGPLTTDVDAAIRALNPTRAIDQILQNMPAETKAWLSAFVAGINHYKQNLVELPHAMQVLDMQDEPWRMQDSIALGRVGGIDINWGVVGSLLSEYGSETWPETWQRVMRAQVGSLPSFESPDSKNTLTKPPQINEQQLALLRDFLGAYARTGSNSFAISSEKSTTGAPIIANDPHLGLIAPNLWIIGGLKSPSYHLVGMMPVGVPVFAFGRNAHIAWGGTNMRQEASDFVDVSTLQNELDEREHQIKTRFWFDTESKNRSHPQYGPVLSDVEILPFPEGRDIALRWTGHLPSDETTAMLGIAQATNWQEMLQAANDFSLPGQNFVFATVDGDIGQILATWIPKRSEPFPTDLFVTPQQSDVFWQDIMKATDLPYIVNPANGMIASANNKPYDAGATRISWYFPVDDRVRRLYQLMGEKDTISLADMQAFQLDTYSISHKRLHDFILQQADVLPLSDKALDAVQAIESWDGYFEYDSRTAYLYHISYLNLAEKLYEALPGKEPRDLFRSSGFLPSFIEYDLLSLSEDQQTNVLKQALEITAEALAENTVWGDIHRVKTHHILGNIPVLGYRYRTGDIPASGHDATILKTSGDLTTQKHRASYGSQSRHISDLSDINANYFVLFGGQDGQINAANLLDQVPLWQSGELIHVPFEVDEIRRQFIHSTKFKGTSKN